MNRRSFLRSLVVLPLAPLAAVSLVPRDGVASSTAFIDEPHQSGSRDGVDWSAGQGHLTYHVQYGKCVTTAGTYTVRSVVVEEGAGPARYYIAGREVSRREYKAALR